MTRQEITKLLETMAATYPNAKIKDAALMVDAWFLVFGQEDAQTILNAATYHMRTCAFFPTIADIQKSIPRGRLLFSNTEQAAPRIPPKAIQTKIDLNIKTGCDICPVWESGQCRRTAAEHAACRI